MKFPKGTQARLGKAKNDYSIFPSDWKIEHTSNSTFIKSHDGKRFKSDLEAKQCLESQTEFECSAKEEREAELEAFISDRMQPKSKLGCLEEGIFISQVTQVENLLKELNRIRKCEKEGCTGNLIISDQKMKGLGGAAKLEITCNGCGEKVVFDSSSTIPGTDRKAVPAMLMLSSLINGSLYSGYQRGMGSVIGDNIYSEQAWQNFLQWLDPIVKQLLDSQCEWVKQTMKDKPEEQLGSWKRAVTSCDGCWQTRGFPAKMPHLFWLIT